MLENFNEMLDMAKRGHYAVAEFGITNMEFAKAILEECEELKVPVILGVSENTVKYLGGYIAVAGMLKYLVKSLNLTIPVTLQLDHATSKEACLSAIDAGFPAVMLDASSLSLGENITMTREVCEYAHRKGVSVEASIGDMNNPNSKATLEDATTLYQSTHIDALSPAIGNKHGFYKEQPNLDFNMLKIISDKLPIPIVLHGATGLNATDLRRAIDCGVCKINVTTDLAYTWSLALKKYIVANPSSYDTKAILSSTEQPLKERVKEFINLFKTIH
jgi:fructose-bisphosphate aldolase class II